MKNKLSIFIFIIILSQVCYSQEKYDWKNVCNQLNKNYEAVSKFHHKNSDEIRMLYREVYSNTTKL